MSSWCVYRLPRSIPSAALTAVLAGMTIMGNTWVQSNRKYVRVQIIIWTSQESAAAECVLFLHYNQTICLRFWRFPAIYQRKENARKKCVRLQQDGRRDNRDASAEAPLNNRPRDGSLSWPAHLNHISFGAKRKPSSSRWRDGPLPNVRY